MKVQVEKNFLTSSAASEAKKAKMATKNNTLNMFVLITTGDLVRVACTHYTIKCAAAQVDFLQAEHCIVAWMIQSNL